LRPLPQVADKAADHSYWGRPEQDPNTATRPVFVANSTQPAADCAAEVAASFAAAAVLFGNEYGVEYNLMLRRRARQLYAFAKAYPAVWSSHKYLQAYAQGSFRDDMLWAAVWMCRLDAAYCQDAHSSWAAANPSSIFDWENVHTAATALLVSTPGASTSTQLATYSGERAAALLAERQLRSCCQVRAVAALWQRAAPLLHLPAPALTQLATFLFCRSAPRDCGDCIRETQHPLQQHHHHVLLHQVRPAAAVGLGQHAHRGERRAGGHGARLR
jgi:hypothetical protein